MKKIGLFFMYRTFGGGTTSFTVHLFRAFEKAGIKPYIFRVKERGEHFERPFSKYKGVKYQNVTADQAKRIVRDEMPTIMTAPCNSKYLPFAPNIIKQLMKRGMRTVIHDPNEFEIYDHLDGRRWVYDKPPFCIRPAMQNFFPKAVFIPHPYVREFKIDHFTPHRDRPHLAVSVARVTFVKRTHIILEINRRMEHERNHVILRGAENRLYTRHVLSKKYPEYEQGHTGYPMTWGASARECEKGVFALDFTYFPDDGGGSQYSFMEAWDAGTVNMLHKDWLRYPGEMNAHPTNRAKGNCIAVKGPTEGADWLRLYRQSRAWRDDCLEIVQNGKRELLRNHKPEMVAEMYWEKLNA